MPLIEFPDVPQAPGVPDLIRNADQQIAQNDGNVFTSALSGVFWQLLSDAVNKTWGIIDSKGQPLINLNLFNSDYSILNGIVNSASQLYGVQGVTSVNSFDYSKETRVADFPVEKGSFADYNKVELPAMPIVRLCMSGSESERTKFINSLELAVKSTNLYTILTPEKNYIGYSIERYSMVRTAQKGNTMLIADIYLQEIRQVTASFAKTQNSQKPDGKPTVSNGQVQTQTPGATLR